MTRNASGVGARNPDAATSNYDRANDHTKRSAGARRVPVASAINYPPAGRRRYALLLVPHCPFCRHAHAHRGASCGGIRRAGCGRGDYLVRPATAARVPA